MLHSGGTFLISVLILSRITLLENVPWVVKLVQANSFALLTTVYSESSFLISSFSLWVLPAVMLDTTATTD